MNGKIAMILDGHWRLPRLLRQIEDGKLKLGVVSLPRRPGIARVNVCMSRVGAFRQTRNIRRRQSSSLLHGRGNS